MNIYAVATGSYSDYRIRALFSTEALARRCIAAMPEQYDDARIELYDLDPDEVLSIPPGHKWWMVFMQESGDCEAPSAQFPDLDQAPLYFPHTKHMRLCVAAVDEAHAVKIAGEKRSQMTATGEWSRIVAAAEGKPNA